MRTLFSSEEVHPRDRFDYWHDVACKNIVDVNAKPDSRLNFHAELQSGLLADINLLLFENAPVTVRHTARQASLSADELMVLRQVAGTITLRQDSREVVLQPDDFTLIDPLRPFSAKSPADSKLLVLKLARRSLEARVGKTREMTACSINPLAFESKLASTVLGLLPAYEHGVGSPTGGIVADQVLDLVAMSFAKAIDGRHQRVSCARSFVLMALRAAIEERLQDAALDVDTVAAIAGVSRRYATAVFAEQGTSIMQFIQDRRLERCRRALQDPSQAHRTVSEIAYGWGFSDMTHFGRKFRAAYGDSPREYRKIVRAGPA